MTGETKQTLKIGHTLGRYRIVEKIGAGGMGEIFLAEDVELGRNVAIKVLSADLAADEDRIRRFVREAKAASALNHPHILTIYEIGEFEGIRFMASEYVKGQTLSAFLEEHVPTLTDVLKIAVQIASALEAAHEAGIIHRDIKPENVMIRSDGIVKVLDFGLAKPCNADKSALDTEGETKVLVKTRAGVIMGTAAYMSPEQARGRETDARTDIWSFGCLLYEMLTREQPFDGETVTDILANIIHREPSSILARRADAPPELERIVARMLRKNKDERYGSTTEVFKDLKELQTRILVESELTRSRELTSVSHIEPAPFLDSIAVLPFSDISTDESSEYFSAGLTEEIIMNLSKLKELKVVARGSAMSYVKNGKSYQQAASELGARYLLDGSVRRHGKELRITAQLIETSRDAYLWAETYRGTIEDIFDIQEKVASEIVQALQLRLSPDEKQVLAKRFTENTEAYQLYLQGRFFWNKRSEESLKMAISYFEKAIEKDPQYALAWAGIADSYALLGEYGNIARKELYPKAKAAVKKALEIDDRLAEARTSHASVLMLNEWDWANSEKEFKIALELNPNYPTALHWYSQWLVGMGRLDEALKMISRAAELDPVSQAILKDKGLTLYYSRQFDEAIEIARITLELDPNYAAAHRLLSLAYQGKGEFDEAIAENREWGALTRNEVETTVALAQLFAASGRTGEAKGLVETVESNQLHAEQVFRGLALVYAALGENDPAFEWLERSYARREESILSLKVDPKVDRLRPDPRFNALLNKIGVLR